MNINKLSTNTNTNFKAIKIATLKNRVMENNANIDIYQIRSEDFGFIQKMNSKINFKKLCTNLTKDMQERWERVFLYCTSKAMKFGNITYLALSENKPCGILTYFHDREFYLDGICAIPNKEGQKTHLAGKGLFYQLFKDAEEADVRGIKLDAITDGPFNVIKKYENLGFKNLGYKTSENDTLYAEMSCNKHKIKAQLKELPFEIEYEKKFERANLNELAKF